LQVVQFLAQAQDFGLGFLQGCWHFLGVHSVGVDEIGAVGFFAEFDFDVVGAGGTGVPAHGFVRYFAMRVAFFFLYFWERGKVHWGRDWGRGGDLEFKGSGEGAGARRRLG